MGRGSLAIGVLELCDSYVVCTDCGPGADDVEKTSVHSLSKINTRAVIWNLSERCHQIDGIKSVGASTHPCFRPPVIGKCSDRPF